MKRKSQTFAAFLLLHCRRQLFATFLLLPATHQIQSKNNNENSMGLALSLGDSVFHQAIFVSREKPNGFEL
ncbi:hypothetical protein V6Z11_D10G219100 [Gossypium hirsutum]